MKIRTEKEPDIKQITAIHGQDEGRIAENLRRNKNLLRSLTDREPESVPTGLQIGKHSFFQIGIKIILKNPTY